MEKKTIIWTITIILLMLMWIGFMVFLFMYGAEVRNNPLSVGCSKLKVNCTCTSDRIPGAFMYIDNRGEISYSYPDSSKSTYKRVVEIDFGNLDEVIAK